MDHDKIRDNQYVERYVLNRMDDLLRAEFEDHFMTCPQCLQDLEETQLFVQGLRVVSDEVPHRSWLTWIRKGAGYRQSWLVAAILVMAFGWSITRTYEKAGVNVIQPPITWTIERSQQVFALNFDDVDEQKSIVLQITRDTPVTVRLLDSHGRLRWKSKQIRPTDPLGLQIDRDFLESGSYRLSIDQIDGETLQQIDFEIIFSDSVR